MNLSSLSNRTKLSKSGTITAKSKSRVRVGIRCRPPFQDEIDFAKGEFVSIIDTKKELPEHSVLGKITDANAQMQLVIYYHLYDALTIVIPSCNIDSVDSITTDATEPSTDSELKSILLFPCFCLE